MKTERIVILIKRICTVLLLISFFLPLSRGCSQTETSFQKGSLEQEEKKAMFSVEAYKGKKKYAYDVIGSPDTDTVTAVVVLFCYFWPIPLLLRLHFTKKKLIKHLISSAELVFCMGTFYFVMMMCMFDELLMGAYLAISSSVVYFCSTVFDLTKEIFHYFKSRTN